jgi:putative transposase
MQAEVKDAYWKIFDIEDLTTGFRPELVKIIDVRIAFAVRYRAIYWRWSSSWSPTGKD